MDENNKASDFIIDDEASGQMEQNVNNTNKLSGRSFIEILKTETGEGSIDEYIDNPLNFNHSKSIAQILRGLSGFLGSLNYALFDIIIGSFNYVKELKQDV